MSPGTSPWETAAKEICASLADGLDVAGTVESADIFTRVGATCLEVVIDASDGEGADQADAHRFLCDLLEPDCGPARPTRSSAASSSRPNHQRKRWSSG